MPAIMIVHPGLDEAPPTYPGGHRGGGGDDQMPPTPGQGEPDEDDDKVPPEKAGYRGPAETCGNCRYWVSPNSCQKVDTVTDPNGSCFVFFSPKSGGGGDMTGPGGIPMMPMVEEGGR